MTTHVALDAAAIRPLRRIEYERLVESGAFVDEKVELIRGVLVRMNPQGNRHAGAIQVLTKLLVRAVGDAAEVRVQLPFAAGDDTEPEPDLAIVPVGSPWQAHPAKAFVIIEVAESSLGHDRLIKADLYAEAGVPEYWIVDVAASVVHVHRDPVRGHYATLTTLTRGDVLELAAFSTRIDVATILPPRE